MRITSGGNVVIGNTVPSNVGLTIYGSNAATIYQTANTGTGAANGFYVGHTGDISYIWNYNNYPTVFATNNTERMRITSGGQVCINTSGGTSGGVFHPFIVKATASYSQGIWVEAATNDSAIFLDNNGSVPTIGVSYRTSAGYLPLAFSTNGTERMRITSGGSYELRNTVFSTSTDVTTTTYKQLYPSEYNIAQIAVRTDGQFYTGAFSFRTADASNANVLLERMRIQSDGTIRLNAGGETTSATLQFYADPTPSNGASIAVSYLGSGSYGPLTFGTGGSERMRITSSGNIGIGTTSPVTRLNLAGSSTQYITLTNGGADGVPNAVQGGIIGQARLSNNNLAQMASILFRNQNSAAWYLGEITFNTNGTDGTNPSVSPTERMRINSDGLVGIGTTSPSANLEVVGGSNTATSFGSFIVRNSSNAGMSFGASSTSYAWIQGNIYGTGIAPIVLQSNGGNVGIGITNPNVPLDVQGNIRIRGASSSSYLLFNTDGSTNNYGGIEVNNDISNGTSMRFYNLTSGSLTEKMRVTSGGDLLVNATATTQGAKFYVNGIGAFGSVYVGALGTGTVYSNAGFLTNTNPSDRRLKNNIIPLTYGLSDILKLNPVSYNWKDGTNGKQFGFIAQEVQEIMPDAVKQGEYLGLEKDAIYSALVNAIKELKQELDTLKNK